MAEVAVVVGHRLAVVRRHHHHRAVGEAEAGQGVDQLADAGVDRGQLAVVVRDVVPPRELPGVGHVAGDERTRQLAVAGAERPGVGRPGGVSLERRGPGRGAVGPVGVEEVHPGEGVVGGVVGHPGQQVPVDGRGRRVVGVVVEVVEALVEAVVGREQELGDEGAGDVAVVGEHLGDGGGVGRERRDVRGDAERHRVARGDQGREAGAGERRLGRVVLQHCARGGDAGQVGGGVPAVAVEAGVVGAEGLDGDEEDVLEGEHHRPALGAHPGQGDRPDLEGAGVGGVGRVPDPAHRHLIGPNGRAGADGDRLTPRELRLQAVQGVVHQLPLLQERDPQAARLRTAGASVQRGLEHEGVAGLGRPDLGEDGALGAGPGELRRPRRRGVGDGPHLQRGAPAVRERVPGRRVAEAVGLAAVVGEVRVGEVQAVGADLERRLRGAGGGNRGGAADEQEGEEARHGGPYSPGWRGGTLDGANSYREGPDRAAHPPIVSSGCAPSAGLGVVRRLDRRRAPISICVCEPP